MRLDLQEIHGGSGERERERERASERACEQEVREPSLDCDADLDPQEKRKGGERT